MTQGKIALERAEKVAAAIVTRLAPYCKRREDDKGYYIEVVGSVRRRKSWVNDIDLVLIPNDLWAFHREVMGLGSMKMSGGKIMRVMVGAIQIDIYAATPETWATLLLIRTGSAQHNIKLATTAKKKGWRLAASGDGLFDETGERIAGDTESSIFTALGLKYLEPRQRE